MCTNVRLPELSTSIESICKSSRPITLFELLRVIGLESICTEFFLVMWKTTKLIIINNTIKITIKPLCDFFFVVILFAVVINFHLILHCNIIQ